MKYLTAILFGAAMAFTVTTAKADETFEGTMCCEKCCMKTADACADALKVGDVVYHLEENGKRKTSAHKCSGTQHAKVTGKVEERDGEKFIVVSSIKKG